MAKLRWFADTVRANIAKNRKADPALKDVRVTVRFAVYEDLRLAEEIVDILERCTRWLVDLKSKNEPVIRPEGNNKILFDVGPGGAFGEVVSAFIDGALVKGKIGHKIGDRWDEAKHLVVDVIPTIRQ